LASPFDLLSDDIGEPPFVKSTSFVRYYLTINKSGDPNSKNCPTECADCRLNEVFVAARSIDAQAGNVGLRV